LAWLTVLGPAAAQIDYRLRADAGCAQVDYRLAGDDGPEVAVGAEPGRGLVWIGDGLREFGLEPGRLQQHVAGQRPRVHSQFRLDEPLAGAGVAASHEPPGGLVVLGRQHRGALFEIGNLAATLLILRATDLLAPAPRSGPPQNDLAQVGALPKVRPGRRRIPRSPNASGKCRRHWPPHKDLLSH
jgi:hypothetical protein